MIGMPLWFLSYELPPMLLMNRNKLTPLDQRPGVRHHVLLVEWCRMHVRGQIPSVHTQLPVCVIITSHFSWVNLCLCSSNPRSCYSNKHKRINKKNHTLSAANTITPQKIEIYWNAWEIHVCMEANQDWLPYTTNPWNQGSTCYPHFQTNHNLQELPDAI